MLCPQCRSGYCRRSRRRSWQDYLVTTFTGLRPWRCRSCGVRFLAWSVAFRYLRFAHCRRCGNLDLQRVSATHVESTFAWIGRITHMPAYRCAPCRNRFFSLLLHHRLRPIEEEYVEQEEARESSSVGARIGTRT